MKTLRTLAALGIEVTRRKMIEPRLRNVLRRALQVNPSPSPPALPTAGALRLDIGGRVALITGGSGELGRVMVRTLARCGADVAVHYHRNAVQAELLVSEAQQLGRRALAIQADVKHQASVNEMVDAVRAHLGGPDIVIVNAVEQIHPWAHLLDQRPEDYESQFRSCVLQAVFLAKATLPTMTAKGWGRLIGVNSECAMQLAPAMSAYGAGKRGMDAVFRVLAREVGPAGITVNQVAPGWTASDKDRARPSNDHAYAANVPLGRRGTDQEVANVVAFLASDLASFVHGVFLPVCGGNVMSCT